jgi:hypothetical protein
MFQTGLIEPQEKPPSKKEEKIINEPMTLISPNTKRNKKERKKKNKKKEKIFH